MPTTRKANTHIKLERSNSDTLVLRQDGIRLGEITGSVGRYYVKDRAGLSLGTAATIDAAIRMLTEHCRR